MLWSMGSQGVGHDLVTEQQLKPSDTDVLHAGDQGSH